MQKPRPLGADVLRDISTRECDVSRPFQQDLSRRASPVAAAAIGATSN